MSTKLIAADASAGTILDPSVGDGTLVIQTGAAGAKVDAISIAADGKVTLPYNPAIFSKVYTSSEQVITTASLITLAHGFGAAPLLYSITLKCITAELGYSIGDVVIVNPAGDYGGTSSQWGIYHDATNINVRIGASTLALTHKTSGVATTSATNANWRMIVRAWA